MLATPQAAKVTPHNVGYLPAIDAPSIDVVDDALMSKEEFFAEVDAALEEVRQGKVYTMLDGETLDEFLNRVRRCTA
jgi:hypothetical protein